MASDSFSYFANKVGMKCNKTERGMHWTRELLELGAEGNLGSLHPEEPSGKTDTISRHKGVCLVWFVLSQCLVFCFAISIPTPGTPWAVPSPWATVERRIKHINGSSTSQESSEKTGSQDPVWISPGFTASPNWISLSDRVWQWLVKPFQQGMASVPCAVPIPCFWGWGAV